MALMAPFDTRNIAPLAREALQILLQHLPADDNERTGGYFVLADDEGHPRYLEQIGEIEEGRLKRYLRNAIEKAERTALTGFETSRRTRNDERERFPGAIAAGDCIGSFSGLPANFDEILVAHVLVGIGKLNKNLAAKLLADNPDFHRLRGLFKWQ